MKRGKGKKDNITSKRGEIASFWVINFKIFARGGGEASAPARKIHNIFLLPLIITITLSKKEVNYIVCMRDNFISDSVEMDKKI